VKYKIANKSVENIIREWFLGPDHEDEGALNHLYVYETGDLVIAAVALDGRIWFLRIFKIGDTWQLSSDATYNLWRLGQAAAPPGEVPHG
jgi:hypothetical protein